MSSSTSSSNARRALLGLLLLLLFFILFDHLLFFIITQTENRLFRDTQFAPAFDEYVRGKNYTTLIFGTSRTYEGIHPHYLSQAFNQDVYKEAQFGKGPKYNYIFYQFFKKHAGIPRVLIYGVDYFIFNIKSKKRWLSRFDMSAWERKNYLSAGPMLLRHKQEIEDFISHALARLGEWLGQQVDQGPALGFVALQKYIGVDLKHKDLVARRPPRFMRYGYKRYPGLEGEYFMKLLEECERDGVQVVLVLLPDYFGTYMTNFRKKLFVKNIEEITQRFDNLSIYNYNLPDKFPLKNEDFFLNGGFGHTNSHLSSQGAKYLCRLFIDDIRHLYE